MTCRERLSTAGAAARCDSTARRLLYACCVGWTASASLAAAQRTLSALDLLTGQHAPRRCGRQWQEGSPACMIGFGRQVMFDGSSWQDSPDISWVPIDSVLSQL